MDRNHRHHNLNHNNQQQSDISPRGRPVTSKDVASAKDYFEHFLNATTLKNILGYYRSICDLLNLRPNLFPLFYPKLKGHLTSWRAKALWKKFDTRASDKCYGKGKLCSNTRVLIIGGGPCGLRTAIEAQLLGAKVVVIEKRDRFTRNNVLHLWPFVIEDLRALAAKKFFGKFCAGSIDHISIRQLQCILLKVALLLGVEVHTEVSFEQLIEPNINEKSGWKATFSPADHPVSQYEFDVIIGADGKRNTLQGFKRKEFRGKLAIAITANFINKRSEAEARVEEISGVAFIFNQKFFNDLYEETGIDLENIVYYKDDTHYFVMTAKKTSLIDKGVIKQDLPDTERLLAPDNVDREALMAYARQAANFSTNNQLPDLEFAVNHYGQSDVAMFDFTSMYAAENASKCIERHGYRLLMILVGDSLLEPFWPTGSGCARGFLSSMDAAWAIRNWSSGNISPLNVIAERESIYRLLAQTTPDNLNKDWKAYTLDPATRYPNLNKNVVLPHQIVGLFDTDNPKSIEKITRNSLESSQNDIPKKKRKGNVDNEVLLSWISEQIKEHKDIEISDVASVFKNGKALCAIINHYRPDLLDYNSIKNDEPAKNNQLAIDVLEKDIGIPPIMTGEEITNTEDYLSMATYLTQVYDNFRREIPHVKHSKVVAKPQYQRPSPELIKELSDKLTNLILGIPPPEKPSKPPSPPSEKPSCSNLSESVKIPLDKTVKNKSQLEVDFKFESKNEGKLKASEIAKENNNPQSENKLKVQNEEQEEDSDDEEEEEEEVEEEEEENDEDEEEQQEQEQEQEKEQEDNVPKKPKKKVRFKEEPEIRYIERRCKVNLKRKTSLENIKGQHSKRNEIKKERKQQQFATTASTSKTMSVYDNRVVGFDILTTEQQSSLGKIDNGNSKCKWTRIKEMEALSASKTSKNEWPHFNEQTIGRSYCNSHTSKVKNIPGFGFIVDNSGSDSDSTVVLAHSDDTNTPTEQFTNSHDNDDKKKESDSAVSDPTISDGIWEIYTKSESDRKIEKKTIKVTGYYPIGDRTEDVSNKKEEEEGKQIDMEVGPEETTPPRPPPPSPSSSLPTTDEQNFDEIDLELPPNTNKSDGFMKIFKTSAPVSAGFSAIHHKLGSHQEQQQQAPPSQQQQQHHQRPSSRHKRHADTLSSNKTTTIERKTRKKRALDKFNLQSLIPNVVVPSLSQIFYKILDVTTFVVTAMVGEALINKALDKIFSFVPHHNV